MRKIAKTSVPRRYIFTSLNNTVNLQQTDMYVSRHAFMMISSSHYLHIQMLRDLVIKVVRLRFWKINKSSSGCVLIVLLVFIVFCQKRKGEKGF